MQEPLRKREETERPLRETRDSVRDIWGPRTPIPKGGSWPVRVDERILEEPDEWIQSTCLVCSNDCGMDVGVKNGKIVGVRGRADDRVNYGRLGPKGLHAWEANNSPDRLKKPLIRKNGELQEAGWDEAMDLIVDKTKKIIEEHTSLGVGFYTSGQLFLEEYYTLAVLGKAGLGTPHMDGNTRLCTATAGAALKETFGTDGQPASYADVELTDAIFLIGHNVAEQQTVFWMRMLDRRRGPNPPKMVVVDPRESPTALEADVHLAPVVGTNLPLMNGLVNLMIENGWINEHFIAEHTTGFDHLKQVVSEWTPERVEQVCRVPADKLRAAAEIVGTSPTVLSTVLQGVYQSNQATATAVMVNNMQLIRGLIGMPGCGVLQMNGQPTAQNTRETGCNGDLPGFRNWDNPAHIEELAKLWNVDPIIIPDWAPPTHALQIWHYAEEGSIKLLWIAGTNPAVSLPDLDRIRSILKKEDLFVVVQDGWMTETSEFGDVVLPAAIWGEKTGTYTNADRTVHISHKAIDPPGEAKSDLDIWLDFADRMGFKDKDGAPLIKWCTPAEAFEAWKECSRGRPCNYSGITYEKLTGGSGIQWPCNDEFPEGKERLYTDHVFNTQADYCETYGRDPVTGASITPTQYRADDPRGKAILRAAEYVPPMEAPDNEYPFWLTTGRIVYHWHTRTKTGRARDLNEAAPDAFVQMSAEDAKSLDVNEGEMVAVTSRRGTAIAPVRIGGIAPGTVFMPFHYGYWDDPGRPRAANEATQYSWDPVSKQPHYKHTAVKIAKSKGGEQPQGQEERSFLQRMSDKITGAGA